MVSVTSARPSGGRPADPALPAKMTSSILPPRNALAPCSPRTQAMASTTLDLPDPLGPTTQVMPGSKRRLVAEAKDLKPFIVRLLRCTALRWRTAVGRHGEWPWSRKVPRGLAESRQPGHASSARGAPFGTCGQDRNPRRLGRRGRVSVARRGLAPAALPAAAGRARGRSSASRCAAWRSPLRDPGHAPAGMSPHRRGDDPGLHRHSREGPSPSRGPPHQTLRWVLGRARGTRGVSGACDRPRVARAGAPVNGWPSRGVSGARSALDETGDISPGRSPPFDYGPYPTRGARPTQPGE